MLGLGLCGKGRKKLLHRGLLSGFPKRTQSTLEIALSRNNIFQVTIYSIHNNFSHNVLLRVWMQTTAAVFSRITLKYLIPSVTPLHPAPSILPYQMSFPY